MRIAGAVAIVVGLTFLASCANKVTPTGGPKDLVPPKVLDAVPPSGSTAFSGKRIEIRFDEYVQLLEPGKQIVISPPIEPKPKIEARKRSIWIMTEAGLEPNTTYTFQFGDAIADIHENNVMHDFRYVIATGAALDTCRIAGMVTDALSGLPVENAIAALYKSGYPDSLMFRKTPTYFTRTGKQGEFRLLNVPAGTYRVVALNDKNNNYLADQQDETIGFLDADLNLTDTAYVKLKLSAALKAKPAIKASWFEPPGKLITVFNVPAPRTGYRFLGTYQGELQPSGDRFSDTLFLWTLPPATPPVQMIWELEDQRPDTVTYNIPRGTEKTTGPPALTGQFVPASGGKLMPGVDPAIIWQSPLSEIDESLFRVIHDSSEVPFSVIFSDSLQVRLVLISKWEPGNYQVQLEPGAVTDIYNRSNDTLHYSFRYPDERSSGTISVAFAEKDLEPSILQLVNEKGEVIAERTFVGNLQTTLSGIDPGIYKLRRVLDLNRDGRWTQGNFFINMLPETVEYYPEIIQVRANWDVEIAW